MRRVRGGGREGPRRAPPDEDRRRPPELSEPRRGVRREDAGRALLLPEAALVARPARRAGRAAAWLPGPELRRRGGALRTYVNGEVVQQGNTGELLFPFAYMLADLSRLITLEPGDVLLTGTPSNSRPVQPGDVVEVEVGGIGRLANPTVEAEEEKKEASGV